MRYTKKKLIFRLAYSFILAIILTTAFCGLYTLGRSFLLEAINNHRISFLDNFDLIGKIQEKCHFDTIPTIWQLQESFMQIFKYFIFALVLSVLLLFMPITEWKEQKKQVHFLPFKSSIIQRFNTLKERYILSNKRWLIILSLLVAIQYGICFSIIYYSWWSADDFYCAMTTGKSFVVRYSWWIWCCLTHVARIGEMIYYIFPLTPDRWAHLTITPAVFVLFPLAIKRLVAPQLKWTSSYGVLLYISSSCMIYLGVNSFSTFCCYAPCTGYIYSSVFVMFILPYYIYDIDRKKQHSLLTIIVFCLCTFFFGTSVEGVAAVFSLLLGVQLIWRYYKGMPLPPLYYLSLITFWIGAAWILFSPGSSIRGMNTPFTGGNVPYNLYGLSLIKKLSYFPEMLFAIWKLTYITLIFFAITILVWVYAYFKFDYKHYLLNKLYISLFIAAISLAMAIIYLAGAIPNGSTFTPCSFGLICAQLYLLVSLTRVFRSVVPMALVSCALCIICICYIAPSLSYSIQLKPYDTLRNARILEQVRQGKKQIELPYRYPADYDSTRTKIPHGINLGTKADYFHVDKIIEAEKQ
jgi:hypothetical protein